MPKVESSMMSHVEYDRAQHELRILFTSGKMYAYDDVPERVYRNLLKDESKGRYFLDCIGGMYACGQIRGRRKA